MNVTVSPSATVVLSCDILKVGRTSFIWTSLLVVTAVPALPELPVLITRLKYSSSSEAVADPSATKLLVIVAIPPLAVPSLTIWKLPDRSGFTSPGATPKSAAVTVPLVLKYNVVPTFTLVVVTMKSTEDPSSISACDTWTS